MKKILIIPHCLSVGGVSQSLLNTVRILKEHGYEIDVVVPSAKNLDFDTLERLKKMAAVRIKDEKQHPVLRKFPYFRRIYEEGGWFSRQSPKKLYEWFVGENSYDVEIAFYFGRPMKIICGSQNINSKKFYGYGRNMNGGQLLALRIWKRHAEAF